MAAGAALPREARRAIRVIPSESSDRRSSGVRIGAEHRRSLIPSESSCVIRTEGPGDCSVEVNRAFGDTVKFRGLSTPGEYSVLARVGDAALAYRSHCWEHDPRT